ncbi:MAG: putative quinol monooxygenase [Bacteroidia bacterium]
MITRLVKLTFLPEKSADFLILFESIKTKIASFEGCSRLELQQSKTEPYVFFTISRWESEAALEAYRQSELFQTTWVQTKALFGVRAEAWTVETCFDSFS